MHYKDTYPAVYDLIKSFFKEASTNPTHRHPPKIAKQGCYMWKKEISIELSQKISELIHVETNSNEDSSTITLGQGSSLTDTSVSDFHLTAQLLPKEVKHQSRD